MAGRVLIVEDQAPVAGAMALLLELAGIASVAVGGADEAVAALADGTFDLVVQDMNFTAGESSGEEGMALFREIRAAAPGLPVLIVTAWPSLEMAVQLVKEGAADYLEKPWDDERLLARVRSLLHLGLLERENRRLRDDLRRARESLAERYDLRGLVYASAAMHEVVSLTVRVARADVPVLVTGPNGTGKEHLAGVLHANSRRRRGPFVKVNLGALPDSLLEAELFGAEAGAFTGAEKLRLGRFEAAAGGTLLLDEVGSLTPAGQAKLLRVLETGEFERLGSSTTRRADVRIVAATNADLREAVTAGTFREDLLFRLNVIELQLPPLAGRDDDVLALAGAFASDIGVSEGGPKPISAAARAALLRHDWPGNVRELRNRIQRALVVADGPEITPADLDLPDPDAVSRQPAPLSPVEDEEAERRRIQEVLLASSGVVARAAEVLGLSRQALYRRMERLGLVVERRVRD